MSQEKLTVAVLFGGASTEHDVSRLSVSSVLRELDREKYEILPVGITRSGEWLLYSGDVSLIADGRWEQPELTTPCLLSPVPAHHGLMVQTPDGWQPRRVDVVFPVLHGMNGEDGTVQGLLELAQLPYVGCGVTGSANCMDKDIAKRLFAEAGIPVAGGFTVYRGEEPSSAELTAKVEAELGWPVFVKPVNLGSSVGVSRACNGEELEAAMAQALLQSLAGQRLMQMLTAQDGGAALNRAAQSAAAGNTKELAAMLSGLMKSPEGMAVMNRINDSAKK